jgi:broad specificity phosphatase PhoE
MGFGAVDGQTTADLTYRPGSFRIWSTQVPGGGSLSDVAVRANRVLRQLIRTSGRCLLFSLGHFLCILTARWLGLAPAHGRPFVLDTGAVSVLGHEHGCPVIRAWNLVAPPVGARPDPRCRNTNPH